MVVVKKRRWDGVNTVSFWRSGGRKEVMEVRCGAARCRRRRRGMGEREEFMR